MPMTIAGDHLASEKPQWLQALTVTLLVRLNQFYITSRIDLRKATSHNDQSTAIQIIDQTNFNLPRSAQLILRVKRVSNPCELAVAEKQQALAAISTRTIRTKPNAIKRLP